MINCAVFGFMLQFVVMTIYSRYTLNTWTAIGELERVCLRATQANEGTFFLLKYEVTRWKPVRLGCVEVFLTQVAAAPTVPDSAPLLNITIGARFCPSCGNP
eukprot:TRINITY_DN16003_c0_g1_i1.p3 TRINITY_DN16003_c0_g1~~TRINITY_DN16003_c0_g1_i1.p3  ORF type:complete len:102 (-),score=5.00 TRINITY_DN16003_c0_g1_i1:90-395(-)